MHGGCMVAMSYIGRYILVENSPYSWMRRGIVSSLEGNFFLDENDAKCICFNFLYVPWYLPQQLYNFQKYLKISKKKLGFSLNNILFLFNFVKEKY
jgi:hypothetical protein